MAKPSEKFVLVHRFFTFLDEWLFYVVLLILLYTGFFYSFLFLVAGIPVVIYGGIVIWVSYKRQWEFERLLLEDNDAEQNSENDANEPSCGNCDCKRAGRDDHRIG